MKAKFLSVLLALTMVLSLLPTTVLADDDEPDAQSNEETQAVGTVSLPESNTGDFTITGKNDVLDGTGATYTNGTITVTGDNVTIQNLTFGDKAKLVVNTTGKFTLNNCAFAPKTAYDNNGFVRNPVKLNVGEAVVTNNTFAGVENGYYNAIEFGIGANEHNLSAATISGNKFNSAIKNNYFSFYNMTGNAVINIRDNQLLNSSKASDGVRISNPNNASATFNIINNTFTYSDSGSNYDALILFQDYSNGQNFNSITLNIEKLSAPQDITTLYYVYQDGTGVITTNQPKITGDRSIEKFFVAKVGTAMYSSLTDAVAAAADGGTIDLVQDVSERLWIRNNENVTLNLNGYTLSSEYQTANVRHGSLTVNGPGTIKETSPNLGALLIKGSTNASNTDYSVATINNVTLEGWAPVFVDQNNKKAYGVKVNLNGATLNGKPDSSGDLGAGIYVNGFITDSENAPIINLDSTTVTSAGEGMYLAGYATTTVNGGSVVGSQTGIEIRAGVLNINGVTVTGNGTPTTITPNGNGSTAEGAGIAIMQHTTKLPITVNVSDGTISGYTGLLESNPQSNTAADIEKVTVNVTGGKFAAINGGVNSVSSEDNRVSITGGYFTSDPTTYVPSETHYVDGSDNGDYPYVVKAGEKPTTAPIIVKDDTTVTVPENSGLRADDITNITANTEVEGVAEAVAPNKAALVSASNVDTTGATKVEVSVEVKVAVTDADLNAENPTMTFTATPKATVTVIKSDGTTETKENVPVSNDLLKGEITVTLPLPESFDITALKQVKHISSSNGSVEYFLKEAKRGAKTFTIDEAANSVTLKIDHFSTFELSGTVTYVEPSRHPSSSTGSTITVGKTENGTITVSPATASKGTNVTITAKPADGYELGSLTAIDANGSTLALTDLGNGKYSFTMPDGKVEVNGTFVKKSAQTFVDVPENAYYAPAVDWAVEKGVTDGTSATTFSPDAACTRAQIVTFLYRAAGSPAVKSTVNPFTDVTASDYYYNAVLWAVENGITTGTSETTFSPNESCTRAQGVTFLYRAVGSAATAKASFTDVSADAYYAPAVDWAVEKGVTDGTSATTFSPDAVCTRAQIVTFLYRAAQVK